MKNALTRKIVSAVAALLVAASLTGCSMYAPPEEPVEDTNVSVTDVSGSDVSGSDVSGSDVVSGADVSASDVVVDDAALADAAMNDYISALNSGDADRLVELTAAPPVVKYFESVGTDSSYLRSDFQETIDAMKSALGNYSIVYDYASSDADEEAIEALKAGIEALSAGDGEKIQAVRICTGIMKLYDVAEESVSGSDVVSSADAAADAVEEAESTMRLYKYDGKWYVYGA